MIWKTLTFVCTTAILFTACSDDENTNVCKHKVGFVTDGGKINDKSFNQSSWNGLLRGVEALGLAKECYEYIETTDTTPEGLKGYMETFINKGFGIIVTTGFQMKDPTREMGKKYPKVYFIGVDEIQINDKGVPDPIPNVAGLIFHEDVGGFMAGALAGLMTQTNKVGQVYGCALPSVARFGTGFINGAKYVKPSIDVKTKFHPMDMSICFSDTKFGKEETAKLIADGADVIFGAGGTTGNSSLEEGCDQGKMVIGVDFDQYDTVPKAAKCLLSSATKNIIDGVSSLVVSVDKGTFKSGDVYGGVSLAPFHDYDTKITKEQKDKLQQIDKDLKAGLLEPCKEVPGLLAQGEGPTYCVPVK